MRFAYADPPYLGCGNLYAAHHSNALSWNDPKTHQSLIRQLMDEYQDGWAMSCSSPSLPVILSLCPSGIRVMAWVKPFAVFKPNVNPAYAWEPVIVWGGRRYTRQDATVRDWTAVNVTLRRGLTGAKPRGFCRWILQLLNAQPGDQFDDLFPGTNAFGAAWAEWSGEQSPLPKLPLELTKANKVLRAG